MHADALLDNFAEDAFYAYWDGKGDETAERTVAVGRAAIRDVLEAGPERRLGLLVSLRDDENWAKRSSEIDQVFRGLLQVINARNVTEIEPYD